jgi:hypothetical protein
MVESTHSRVPLCLRVGDGMEQGMISEASIGTKNMGLFSWVWQRGHGGPRLGDVLERAQLAGVHSNFPSGKA